MGLVVGLTSALAPVGYAIANPAPTPSQVRFIVIGSLSGGILGAVGTLLGSHFRILGLQSELDAVDAYNADLVNGRLHRAPVNP